MIIKEDDVKHIILKLRGVFPGRLHIGGSYAISKVFPNLIPDDVDIFIKGDRTMESWAIVSLLDTIFDSVITSMLVNYYKIKGQYMFLQCFYKSKKYDLIFISGDTALQETCGSTLSKLFLDVNYSENIITHNTGNKEVLSTLLYNGVCHVGRAMCTPSYLEKTLQRCKELDLKVKYIY